MTIVHKYDNSQCRETILQEIDMSINIICIQCSSRLAVPAKRIGMISECPKCKGKFKIEQAVSGTIAVMSILDSQRSELVITKPIPKLSPHSIARKTRTELQETPFFVGNSIVADCPWCNKRLKILPSMINCELECKRCDRLFEVRVENSRKIPITCPNCLLRMEVGDHMAGRTTKCIQRGCHYEPILVPDSPIVVKKIVESDSSSVSYYTPPARTSRGLCLMCGQRFVRNPTGVCYKCRRW